MHFEELCLSHTQSRFLYAWKNKEIQNSYSPREIFNHLFFHWNHSITWSFEILAQETSTNDKAKQGYKPVSQAKHKACVECLPLLLFLSLYLSLSLIITVLFLQHTHHVLFCYAYIKRTFRQSKLSYCSQF